jgi:hypothetical protein
VNSSIAIPRWLEGTGQLPNASCQPILPNPDDDPYAYRQALLTMVGDTDPLSVLESTSATVREMLDGVAQEHIELRPVSGEWSVAEIIGHLLDDEVINAFRMRQSLTLPDHPYPGTDPDGWSSLPRAPFELTLRTWEALRAVHIELIRSLGEDQLALCGLHAEQGPESVSVQVRKNAGHDLAHVEQIRRTLVSIGSVKTTASSK